MDEQGTSRHDIAGDITWLTYAELGAARGISAASAKRLAIRRHWRRHPGNDGTKRVAVPVTEAMPRQDKAGDDAGDVTRTVTALESAIAALREQQDWERAALRELIDQQRSWAERAEQHNDDFAVQIEAMEARLAAAETAADQARAQAQAAQARAEEAERDDAARRSLGLLARLKGAWRGE
jgi:hypothetical protein